MAGNGLPEAPAADYPGGSASIKEEVDARHAHEGDGTSAIMGTSGEAPPVPCESDDGDVQLGVGSPRPPGTSTEAEDGFPSFSPVGMAPGSPAGLDGVQGTDGPGLSFPTNGGPSISDELSLFSFIEDAGRARGQDGCIHPLGAANGGGATYEGAAVTCEPPTGVIPLPAVTSFGGGISATDGANGADSDANVAHSVEVSESEGDPEAPPLAPAPASPLEGSAREALQ